ncbi:ABC transporter permease, partial [bacterium]|nr:ABC transporter permease [bacterium]
MPGLPGAGEVAARKARTLWGDAIIRLRKNKLAIAGLVWITLIVAITLSADLWVPQNFADPTSTEFAGLESPSAAHPFGTDRIGRDVFSRVIYGAR